MINKEDYIQAMELNNGTPCYILYNLDEDQAIVVTNKDVAERILHNDTTVNQMKESKLYVTD